MASGRDAAALTLKIITFLVLLTASVFAIVALATHSWNIAGNNYVGPYGFRQCNTGAGTCDTCRFQSCSVKDCAISNVGLNIAGQQCHALRTVQAFSVMATICFIAAWLLSILLFFNILTWLVWAVAMLAFWGGVFGLIAMAVWAGKIDKGGYRYGYGFGLFTAAWALSMLLSWILCATGPRDLKDNRDRTDRTGRPVVAA
jgi:hypothetical protein